MNTELLKLRILVAVQDLKISFYVQKFSLFYSPHFQLLPHTMFALATAVLCILRGNLVDKKRQLLKTRV